MNAEARVKALRQARAEMSAVRERILTTVSNRSDAELLAPPATGGWCAAEVLDHLHTAESKLVKGLKRIAAGQPVRLPKRVWFYRLPMGIAFTQIRIKAPGPVRPRAAGEIVPKEVVERLGESRRDLLEIADSVGEERFSRLLFPHFLLGRFDGLDWYRFLTNHESRHLAQIERILSSSAAPATR